MINKLGKLLKSVPTPKYAIVDLLTWYNLHEQQHGLPPNDDEPHYDIPIVIEGVKVVESEVGVYFEENEVHLVYNIE